MTANAIPSRAFFGRRKGKTLRPRQAGLLQTLLPKLALDPKTPRVDDLRMLFPAAAEVRLEIGFGGGEHLAEQAAREPRVGFIGSEPFVNGMAKMLALIEERRLTNVRLHHGDAAELLAWLPDHSLSGVDLIYPDPWPKRRHWKRRFIQDESITALARLLTGGAQFRFATDIPDYAAWTLRHFAKSGEFVWTAERADDWQRPWPGFSSTRYELKAKKAGRTPCYLMFRRNGAARAP